MPFALARISRTAFTKSARTGTFGKTLSACTGRFVKLNDFLPERILHSPRFGKIGEESVLCCLTGFFLIVT